MKRNEKELLRILIVTFHIFQENNKIMKRNFSKIPLHVSIFFLSYIYTLIRKMKVKY